MPHICPVLADVGFHGCPPITLYHQQILKSMATYTLHSRGLSLLNPTSAKTGQTWATRALSQIGL